MGNHVLLINPGDQTEVFQGLAFAGLTAKEPPVWCRLIASYLRVKGVPVDILDAEGLELSAVDVAEIVNKEKPALVAIVVHGGQPSASTQKMPVATATVMAIRQLTDEPLIVMAGGHPAALPERTLLETGADAVVTGEGPVTIYDLYGACIKHKSAALDDQGEVPGICHNYFGNGPVTITSPAQNVWRLDDEMPGGCWDLLPPLSGYRSYRHHAWSNDFRSSPYASIYTSLGCPYSCSFCMIQASFRAGDQLRMPGVNSYRRWAADTVIKEIEELVERRGVTNIKINDEMFVLHEGHVFELCERIKERYGDRLNLWCYGRVDQTKEKFLDRLRAAGFKWIALGIESLSNEVRDGVGKADYGAEEIFDTVGRIRAAGINIIANYIFGLPDDTLDSMEETLRLATALRTEYVNMYCAVAFPGSELYGRVVDSPGGRLNHGLVGLSDDWLAWSFHSYEHQPLGTNELSSKEVLAFRDAAFVRYFNNSGYQHYVLGRFGSKAIAEVDRMLGHRLSRRLLGD